MTGPEELEGLAAAAGIPVAVLEAIRRIESGGNARAVRFETRLFLRDAGVTIEGHTREAFERAYAINPAVAVTSTSWGLYQVLGGAMLRVYRTPAAGVRAFDADPEAVSDVLLATWFSVNPRARAAALGQRWSELARLYNGSSVSPWLGRFMAALSAATATSAGAALGALGDVMAGEKIAPKTGGPSGALVLALALAAGALVLRGVA